MVCENIKYIANTLRWGQTPGTCNAARTISLSPFTPAHSVCATRQTPRSFQWKGWISVLSIMRKMR